MGPYTDPSYRLTYTPSQINQYLDVIRLPTHHRSSTLMDAIEHGNASSAQASDQLALLSSLIKYQICFIPFENLELHYSTHHTITLDPLHLFHKMVERQSGRGGYCLENTALLCHVLRSLGYQVMPTGARVNEAILPISQTKAWTGPKYHGFDHMALIVTIDQQHYLVDVGLGSNSPCFPIPLEDGFTSVNIAPHRSISLRRQHIPDNTTRGIQQELWVYSIRLNDEMDWMPAYCFSEIEFLPSDFDTMNFFISKSPTGWFTYTVVALRYLMDDQENIIGDIRLTNGTIKERKYGKSEDVYQIENEQDRIYCLETFLGIRLSGAERQGIRGMCSEL